MLSRLVRYGGAAAVSVIPKSNNKFPHLRRFCSVSFSSIIEECLVPYPIYEPPPDAIERWFETMPNQVSASIAAQSRFETMLSHDLGSISDFNTFLSCLLKIGCLNTVLSLAQKLEEEEEYSLHKRINPASPDNHTWAILITCHSREGNMSKAISYFHKIINHGHHPTTQTLNDILDGFCSRHQIHKAMLFYNDVILKKGFQFQLNHSCYFTLINGLCKIGETQTSIQLLRHALHNIDIQPNDLSLSHCYHSIMYRLCKDRLINQAYDLYYDMVHVNNIKPNDVTYDNLIYGHCILGQFKQAIGFFREFKASRAISPTPLLLSTLLTEREEANSASPTPHTLGTEGEVKSAKSVAAVMIKGGVKPNAACFHSVAGGLFKAEAGSTRVLMHKIAQIVKVLLLSKPNKFTGMNYD